MRIILLLVLSLFITTSPVYGTDITTLTLYEKESITTSNYPLTFGHVFKQGGVPDYVAVVYNGTELATQCDVKTTYSDGSVRFTVISVILPSVLSGSKNTITLINKATTTNTGMLEKTDILKTNIEDEIRLTNLSGSGYSGSLTANLNAAIESTNFKYWLKGSVVTEILVTESLNNSLNAAWEVRFYPATSFGIRISHAIENVNADYRGNIFYDTKIQAGTPTLSTIYTHPNELMAESSRWRKVLWVGAQPPETELHYDISYFISTGAIMNYDTSLTVPESTLASAYTAWSNSDHEIMGNGSITKYFPTTGGREDIGILPTWAVMYLLTMDNRMREITLSNGEMIASAPAHYREADVSKSFYNHPISIDDRPTVWTTASRAHTFGALADKLPEPIGDVDSAAHGWSIEKAHQGSFAYMPYLITGEYFYLQEMYYWASWCLSYGDYNSDWGRDYSTGLIRDQVRGEAWAFRNIVDAAALAEDGSLDKTYFSSKISNNITKWNSEKDRYSFNYWGIDKYATILGLTSDVKYPTSPWMEDFMLLSLVHANEQQFSTSSIIDWYGEFIINRFSHPDFNWYNGCPYRFPAQLTDGSYPLTWAQAKTLFADQPSSFPIDDYTTSFRFVAMAALSTQTDKQKGQRGYNWLKANVNDQNELNEDPTWAIIPKTHTSTIPKILFIEIQAD